MNQPWIYMCSPSRSPLPPPAPSDPSLSSQCTSPEHLSHAFNLGWWSVSPLIVYLFQCYSFRTSHPCLLPQSPKVCSVHLCGLSNVYQFGLATFQVLSSYLYGKGLRYWTVFRFILQFTRNIRDKRTCEDSMCMHSAKARLKLYKAYDLVSSSCKWKKKQVEGEPQTNKRLKRNIRIVK